ncbi:MAG: CpaF family protein [Vallitaleaceae bacterium]|jgi:pilus assembly protein CpaF|nr:CpaF family protein [Vallitaleaceae bacterium]
MKTELINQIKTDIHGQIEEAYRLSNNEIMEMVDELVRLNGQEYALSIDDKIQISKDIYNELRGMAILQPLLDDQAVTEIMVNGFDAIYVEQSGQLIKTNLSFETKEKLEDMIQKIVSGINRLVNEASPICDARLEDGSRVNVVLPPIALNGPILTIRKFAKGMITMADLVSWGSATSEMAAFLKSVVEAKYNIFICGGTGSGKTTLLNILSNYILAHERIITIEDSAELQLKKVDHIVRLEARNHNMEGIGAITIRDLIKTSLRMRPDRIIVGEVRGHEAIDMLQAMNTGHDGSLSTGHANSVKDMIARLETMVLLHEDMPMKAVRNQIASAIDLFIFVGRTKNYERKILQISEVISITEEAIELNPIYEYRHDMNQLTEHDLTEDRSAGFLQVGQLQHTEKLILWGSERG